MIRNLAKAVLTAPPIYPMLRTWARRGNRITILCYHTLSADEDGPDAWTAVRVSDFRQQISELRQHYDIVDLDTALAPGAHERPQAVVTFDDGDVGLAMHLPEIVRTEDLPVLIYVATGQIETGEPYWFDRVMNALCKGGPYRVDLEEAGLGVWIVPAEVGATRWAVVGPLCEALKQVDPELREILAKRIEAQISRDNGSSQKLGPMSLDELKSLAIEPRITFGAHSHCHNLLDQIPLEQARESVQRSRVLLEHWTEQKIKHFAYPNGNHNLMLQELMAELGFASSVVLDGAIAVRDRNNQALSRLPIGRYDEFKRFRLSLAGI